MTPAQFARLAMAAPRRATAVAVGAALVGWVATPVLVSVFTEALPSAWMAVPTTVGTLFAFGFGCGRLSERVGRGRS